MKKYSKKIALILVLALTLSAAIPVLAAGGQQTIINGKYEDPTIDVVLTTGTIKAIINPYGLPVELKADDNSTVLGKVTNSQIVTAKPLVGYSLSEVDLNVGATVVGEPAGDFRLATEAPEADSTVKTGLVYLEMKTVNDLGYVTASDTTAQIGQLTGSKILTELNAWAKKAYAETNADQLIVSSREATKNGMCTLKAAVDASGNKLTTPATTGGYMLARLSGDVVKAPKDEWVAADGVDVTISWIFEPNVP